MIWSTPRMIEHYHLALLRLVTGLLGLAGIEAGTGVVATLPRRVRSEILKVLRQAESAARRLIYAEAREMEFPEYVPREKREKTASDRTRKTGGAKKTRAKRIPLFQLFDAREFFEELFPNRKQRRPRRKRRTERQLLFRIGSFDGRPPYEEWAEADPELSPDDPLNAVPLCRRIQALYHALSDLPKQAERMVREMARRAAEQGASSDPPLRQGKPPGHRKRHIDPVDGILHECHCIAMRDPVTPDGV